MGAWGGRGGVRSGKKEKCLYSEVQKVPSKPLNMPHVLYLRHFCCGTTVGNVRGGSGGERRVNGRLA